MYKSREGYSWHFDVSVGDVVDITLKSFLSKFLCDEQGTVMQAIVYADWPCSQWMSTFKRKNGTGSLRSKFFYASNNPPPPPPPPTTHTHNFIEVERHIRQSVTLFGSWETQG